MKRHSSYRMTVEAMVFWLVLFVVFGGSGVLAEIRSVDQGRAGVSPWMMQICDSTGTNCVGTETTGTPGVYRLLTSTSAGGAGGGTVAQGTNGSAAAPWYVTFTTGTITQLPAVSQTSGTVNSSTINQMPAITGTVTANPAGTTTITGTVTGTVTANPAGTTTVTGTVQANAGTGTQNVTFTNTAIQANQGTAANSTAGWPILMGSLTSTISVTSASPLDTTIGLATTGLGGVYISNLNSGSVTGGNFIFEVSDDGGTTWRNQECFRQDTFGAIANTQQGFTSGSLPYACPVGGTTNFRLRVNPVLTGTGSSKLSIGGTAAVREPVAYISGGTGNMILTSGANATSAPVMDGGRASTDTTASAADAAVKVLRVDKWGDLIIERAPREFNTSTTGSLTATTASSIVGAAPGANYRWAIHSFTACNLSGVVATQLNLTDSSGGLWSFPWTQTATTAGEPRCQTVTWEQIPRLTAANSTISVQLTTSNATGIWYSLEVAKTGT